MKRVLLSTLTAFTLFSGTFSVSAQVINGNEVQSETQKNPEIALVNLPKTTGKYQVGSTTFDWVDSSRKDLFDPKNNRELMVQVWYPMDNGSRKGKEKELYIPASESTINQIISTFGLGERFDDVNHINTRVYKDGALSDGNKKFPIVLLSHGLGMGNWNYQWLTRELASHGFIVFSIEHPHFSYGTEMKDGRFIPIDTRFLPGNAIPGLVEYDQYINRIWVKDIQFVIHMLDAVNKKDRNFKNRLDLNKIAAVGHSMGGAAAARALQVEPRIKSAINMDGAFMGMTSEESMTKPFAFIASESNKPIFTGEIEQPLPPGLDPQKVQDLREMSKEYTDRYKQAVAGPAYDITIGGGSLHSSFTDLPLLRPYLAGTIYDNDVYLQPNPEHTYELSNRVILSFLEKTLNGKKHTILDRENVNISDLTIDK